MKKMKYLFVFLIALCFLPNMVSATQSVYYNSYKVGDEITVTLDKDGKVKAKFRVIEASKEGNETNVPDDYVKGTADYQYVTAIYEGIIGNSIYADTSEEITYEDSVARSNLVIQAKDAGWINYESIRLLTDEDIHSMIKSLSTEAQTAIYGVNYSKVTNSRSANVEALKEYLPFLFLDSSYWLGEDTVYTTYCPTGQGCAQVLRNYGTAFSSTGFDILTVGNSLGLRPVIKIHKGFVEGGMVCNCEDCVAEEPTVEKYCPNDSKISIQACLDEGTSEENCIKKLCPSTETVENPKTGSYLPILGLGIASLLASVIYVGTKNKTYFKKIK